MGYLSSPPGGASPLVVARDATQTPILGGTSGQTFGNLALPALPKAQQFRFSAAFTLLGPTGSSFRAGFQIMDAHGALASVTIDVATVKLGSPNFGSNWVQMMCQNINSQQAQFMVTVGQQTFPANNGGFATVTAQLTNGSAAALDLRQPSTGNLLIDTSSLASGGTYFFSIVEQL